MKNLIYKDVVIKTVDPGEPIFAMVGKRKFAKVKLFANETEQVLFKFREQEILMDEYAQLGYNPSIEMIKVIDLYQTKLFR